MPNLTQNQQARPSEFPEIPIRGPFGGIQSEVPPAYTEGFGQTDILNMVLRKGTMTTRMSFLVAPAFSTNPSEQTNAVFDFYRPDGTRVGGVITNSKLRKWNQGNPGSWTDVTAAGAFTSNTNINSWAVVAGKLLFANGIDNVQLWDGSAGTFAQASANAVPCKYLMELDRHLILGNTIEAGPVNAPQKIRWTGAGDPTDYISAGAGNLDLFNDLGPIQNLIKLYQNGFIFQQNGITQMTPTGIGTNPFAFTSLSSRSRGLFFPWSLAGYGELEAGYVAKDNVYIFDGTNSNPIGDFPMEGARVRLGARKRIFADLMVAGVNQVFGVITTSINGNDYRAYWLFIPGVSTWVFNLDEQNWTRFSFAKSPSQAGVFFTGFGVRIIDLIGQILAQAWTPATLPSVNPLDAFLIGFGDGTTGIVTFTDVSEQPFSATWTFALNDYRHKKTIKAIRLVLTDVGQVTFALTITSEKGQSASQVNTVGTGSGKSIAILVPFGTSNSVNGMFLDITVSGASGQPLSIDELTPLYDLGEELRVDFTTAQLTIPN